MNAASDQRRSSFRVPVANPGWLTAALYDDRGDHVGAIVMDLSRIGLGARLPADIQVSRGVRLRCRISLEESELDTEVTVRHCVPESAATRIGLEFTALAPLQESLVSRTVFRLQRLLLRRQHRPLPVAQSRAAAN